MSEKIKVQELTIDGTVYVPKESVTSKVLEINGEKSVWEIGKNYLIRTVTTYQLGTLINITEKELVLANASWIADTGRFSEALKTGSLKEIEIFIMPIIISRGAVVDATEWIHSLPKETK